MLLSGKATPLSRSPRDHYGKKLTPIRKCGFACKSKTITSALKVDGAQSAATPDPAQDFHQLLLETQQSIIQVHPRPINAQ